MFTLSDQRIFTSALTLHLTVPCLCGLRPVNGVSHRHLDKDLLEISLKISLVRKMRHRGMKRIGYGHRARKWQNWDSHPGSLPLGPEISPNWITSSVKVDLLVSRCFPWVSRNRSEQPKTINGKIHVVEKKNSSRTTFFSKVYAP